LSLVKKAHIYTIQSHRHTHTSQFKIVTRKTKTKVGIPYTMQNNKGSTPIY